eukprot:1021911-Rhodomonas_salina.1
MLTPQTRRVRVGRRSGEGSTAVSKRGPSRRCCSTLARCLCSTAGRCPSRCEIATYSSCSPEKPPLVMDNSGCTAHNTPTHRLCSGASGQERRAGSDLGACDHGREVLVEEGRRAAPAPCRHVIVIARSRPPTDARRVSSRFASRVCLRGRRRRACVCMCCCVCVLPGRRERERTERERERAIGGRAGAQ